MTELLAAGIDCRPVRPAGGVRVNITITEPDGTTTKLNSPGASVEAGAPPEFSAQLVRRLRDVPRHGGSGHQ